MRGGPTDFALRMVSTLATAIARMAAVTPDPHPPDEILLLRRDHAGHHGDAPAPTTPAPETAVNEPARSIVSRMNRRLSIARS